MHLCNNLLFRITQYLDIKTLCIIMLYIPRLKNEIGKSYCIANNIFNKGYNITNYANTILYFQNNYIYRCYHCGKGLNNKYYLVICPCVINALNVDLVYTKYHLSCLDKLKKIHINFMKDSNTKDSENNKDSETNKVKIINCQFCNEKRMCFICNLYS